MPSTTLFLQNMETVFGFMNLKTVKRSKVYLTTGACPKPGVFRCLLADYAARATVRRAKMLVTLLAFNFNACFKVIRHRPAKSSASTTCRNLYTPIIYTALRQILKCNFPCFIIIDFIHKSTQCFRKSKYFCIITTFLSI